MLKAILDNYTDENIDNIGTEDLENNIIENRCSIDVEDLPNITLVVIVVEAFDNTTIDIEYLDSTDVEGLDNNIAENLEAVNENVVKIK